MATSNSRTLRHITLLGGFKATGSWQVPDRVVTVSPIGGAHIDLTQAPFSSDLEILKISLIGGVDLRVPKDVPVDVEGFSLLGGANPAPAPEPSDRDAPRVRVRAYGVVGGVSVTRG